MKIRTRLTLQFLLIGGMIVLLASLAIYYASAAFRTEDFFNRLRNNSLIAARLLLEADNIDAGRVERLESDNPVKLDDEMIIILNFRDDTLYSSDTRGFIDIDYSIIERIRLHEEIDMLRDKYALTGTLYISRFDRFVVLAAATDTDGHYFLNRLKMIIFLAALISIILFAAAGWIYSGRALRPISDVVSSVEDISIASLNHRLSTGNGTDEIARLAMTFNKMLSRLEAGLHIQKDFIANASHELRTPLTSINGQLEVLLMKDRSETEYRIALESVLEDISKLIILSNRLLLMARTNSESELNPGKAVRIDEILWQAKDELVKIDGSARIGIELDENVTDSDQMLVSGDENLLKVAMSNLIENACKYSADRSVNISLSCTDGCICIRFSDNGIGIPETELKKVFEPFYRASNAKSFNGTGIGLPLVKQILNKHNGTLRIESKEGEGTTVTVSLPLRH
ncbi:MAG: ATP-binding protein [Bacteroidales bacterium]|jgi:signal transduction histidine kinase|nr:ATP-binding protein [Bacteroidales bacterium]